MPLEKPSTPNAYIQGAQLKSGGDEVQKVPRFLVMRLPDVGVHRFQLLEMCAELQVRGTFSNCEVSRAVRASEDKRAERAKLQIVDGTGDMVMAIGHRCSEACLQTG